MNKYKSIFKEQPEENESVSKSMSMAQQYMVKAARQQGFSPQRALLAIDDLLDLYNAIMQKGTYDKSMSNLLNRYTDILKQKWGIE